MKSLWYATLLVATGGLAVAAQPAKVKAGRPDTASMARLAQLEAEVSAAEDISAIKRLQRTYGYFVDKGLWADLAEYFTDDAVASYPAGVFVGKDSIRQHLYRNVGGVQPGDVGLGDNRLYNHLSIQPVVHLDPGGRTAQGRWRALATFGSLGGSATWAEGIYEMQYAKLRGVWRISKLEYYPGFSAAYATGWVAPPPGDVKAPVARAPRSLAHPADRERVGICGGFPAACIAPFHYANPGTPAGGQVWDAASLPAAVGQGPAGQRAAQLALRVSRLQDEQQIENLQRIYGYYIDRGQWDQAADLFARDGRIELDQRGVYVGRERVRRFLNSLAPPGPQPGVINDRLQLQVVADVSADGRRARVRSREWGMTGQLGLAGRWSDAIHENAFVKEEGVWKIESMHVYPTYITDYDQGWGKDAQPAPGIDGALLPDLRPSEAYSIYPKAHVPPYHYRNPVTGKPVTYPVPERGGPTPALARAALFDVGRTPPLKPVRDLSVSIADSARRLERVKDQHEIENLESAYGYYLDKNLWTDLGKLFTQDGSIELAQRGVYRGARLREFLSTVFGRGGEGPVAGRLGNHLQLQPVIHVADDGSSARIRSRMLQQMSAGPRASIGAAVYENVAVKEGGVWKLAVDHAYNTLSADYQGGWSKAPGRNMPGPTPGFAWDGPPTVRTALFPVVYDIPYHYANPVSGRSDVALPPSLDTQLARFPVPAPAPPVAVANVPPGMLTSIAATLREIGPKIDAVRTGPLYAPLLPQEPYQGVRLERDLAYGPHERHRLDVFAPLKKGKGRPVVVFVHGGGFSRGAKHTPGAPFYDNIGLWAASQDLIGITVNYRLAPQYPYPAGVEDLERVVAWVRAHAREYGGDMSRIYLWGHSAGGAHVADYLVRTARPRVAGAILTSGIYTLGNTVSVWKDYYGDDVSRYPERESLPLLAKSPVPLLVTRAELDPESFVADSEALIKAREAARTPTRALRLPAHSHISETYAVGTADDSLSSPVLQFIRDTPH